MIKKLRLKFLFTGKPTTSSAQRKPTYGAARRSAVRDTLPSAARFAARRWGAVWSRDRASGHAEARLHLSRRNDSRPRPSATSSRTASSPVRRGDSCRSRTLSALPLDDSSVWLSVSEAAVFEWPTILTLLVIKKKKKKDEEAISNDVLLCVRNFFVYDASFFLPR